MTLGEVDRVTAYKGGLALADEWGVPAENRFVRHRGHFSASLAIGEPEGPLERLVEVLRDIGPGSRRPT
jgi:hypothetical protein